MSHSNFNLVTEAWIPVRDLKNGQNRLISLEALFKEAALIHDLDCPAHERISLMRLLVCITHAELGAPATDEDWDGFGEDMESRIPAYLNRSDIHPHFNLFGDGPRFLQHCEMGASKAYPSSQMVFHFSTGNSPTLLDHEGSAPRKLAPAFLARATLAYQNFFVGGSMASKVKGNGPSLKILHTFLIGANLKQTMLSNLLDQQTIDEHYTGMGRPYWEQKAFKADNKILTSFLARLVPRSCALYIEKDGEEVKIDQGNDHPECRESTATIFVKDNDQKTLRADRGKGLWKDLHTITVLRQADIQEQRAPLTLQSHFDAHQADEVHLWLGELVKAKDAKIVDLIESNFTVPKQLFQANGRTCYEGGITYAETQSKQIYGAVKQYGAAMKNDSPPVDLAKKHFWNALEQQVSTLLNIVRDESIMAGKSFGEASDPWTLAVHNAARDAYEKTCPRQTPRQLQAYATGLRSLRPKTSKPKKQKETATK
jgi:CRISPR system Cascade subunit CasA